MLATCTRLYHVFLIVINISVMTTNRSFWKNRVLIPFRVDKQGLSMPAGIAAFRSLYATRHWEILHIQCVVGSIPTIR
jgi:hypothetical protein